jgi:hypothetical protein
MKYPDFPRSWANAVHVFVVLLGLAFVVLAAYTPSPFDEEVLLAAGILFGWAALYVLSLTPVGKRVVKRVWNSYVRSLPDGVRGYHREEP